jgi:hypothetical protein
MASSQDDAQREEDAEEEFESRRPGECGVEGATRTLAYLLHQQPGER